MSVIISLNPMATSLQTTVQNSKSMKSISRIFCFALLVPFCACSQIDFKKIGKQVDKTINQNKPLTNDEIIRGLKEALNVGSKNASSSASKADGYFKNPIIKIPFPPEAKNIESKVRALGMNKQVDDFILTINRAAEEAAKEAAPIFLNAITSMTITDGVGILKGNDSAATNYLKRTTSSQLHEKFKPVIKSATQKVNVTKYWNPVITSYNKIPLVTKMNPDLEEYITQCALSGLFYLVSQEETKIRKDPAARVNDILKKVFGHQ
jgi:hypothetical protein